jgi:hypothetical protein
MGAFGTVDKAKKANKYCRKCPANVRLIVGYGDIVWRWPDRFPPGALAALSRPPSSVKPSATCGLPYAALTRDNVRPTRAYGPAVFCAKVPQRATEHATHNIAVPRTAASPSRSISFGPLSCHFRLFETESEGAFDSLDRYVDVAIYREGLFPLRQEYDAYGPPFISAERDLPHRATWSSPERLAALIVGWLAEW